MGARCEIDLQGTSGHTFQVQASAFARSRDVGPTHPSEPKDQLNTEYEVRIITVTLSANYIAMFRLRRARIPSPSRLAWSKILLSISSAVSGRLSVRRQPWNDVAAQVGGRVKS